MQYGYATNQISVKLTCSFSMMARDSNMDITRDIQSGSSIRTDMICPLGDLN